MNIIAAFEKSMGEYDHSQKSKHWEDQFKRRQHLYVADNLANFRSNDEFAQWLDDQYPLEEQQAILDQVISEIGKEYVYRYLDTKNIGNAKPHLQDGEYIIDGGQLFHIRWLHDLEEHVFSQHKPRYVCEIGGGYGSFAQKIHTATGCTYIMIDLPEANLLSSYYLSQHFPDARFLLCDDVSGRTVTKAEVDAHDFVILPPWYEVDGVPIDLFINTRSMMEMDFSVIESYFDRIHRTIAENGYFLNINRYSKNTVGYPIDFWRYPYDSNWSVLLSQPSWRQPRIHQLLTKRVAKGGNVQPELKNIAQNYKLGWHIRAYRRLKRLLGW